MLKTSRRTLLHIMLPFIVNLVLTVGNKKVLKLLLNRKPDLCLKNIKNKTPINISNNKDIVNIFSEYLQSKKSENKQENINQMNKININMKSPLKLIMSNFKEKVPKSYRPTTKMLNTSDSIFATVFPI